MKPTSLIRTLVVASLTAGTAASASAVGLGGSPASMRLQHSVAQKNDFTFIATDAQLRRFVDEGILVPLEWNDDLTLANVAHAVARPAIVEFVQRLAQDYRAAVGAPLVVTSLTRPLADQPRNAHALSVHPTGMAIDLRIPASASARAWLEKTLLAYEKRGLLDVTRERNPAHYHVAVFPEKYSTYAATLPALVPSPRSSPAERVARAAIAAAFAHVPDFTYARDDQPSTLALFAAFALATIGLGMMGGSVRGARART